MRAKAQDYFESLGGGVDHDLFDQNEQSRQARSLSEEVSLPGVVTRVSELIEKNYADCCRTTATNVQENLPLAEYRVRSVVVRLQCRLSV